MSTYVGYIYCITNKVNGKQYIGQTNTSVSKRYAEHLRCANSDVDTSSLLYRAIRKYGVDNFYVDSLELVTSDTKTELKDLLNDREIFYVANKGTYKPKGYNMTKGGCAFADHVVIPVAQVLPDGMVVAVYESMQDAEMTVDIPYGSIKRALNCDSHYANGYFWYRNDDFSYHVGDCIGKQHRNDIVPVFQFDMDGNLLRSFNSLSEAERITGINHSKISAVCSGIRKSTGGFIWSYTKTAEAYFSNQKTHKCKAVVQMDMYGDVVCTYPSAAEAARKLKLHQAIISKCCLGQRKSTGGYQWAFLQL